MKRPLAVIGLTLLLVMSVTAYFNSVVLTVVVAVSSFVLFIISLFFEKSRHLVVLPTVLLSATAGCLLLLLVSVFSYIPSINSVSDNAVIVSEAAEYPTFSYENGRYYCVTRVKSIDGKNVNCKARLSLPKSGTNIPCEAVDIKPGDEIVFSGKAYVIAEDYEEIHKNYKSKGVYLGAYPTSGSVAISSGRRTVGFCLQSLRKAAIERLRESFGGKTAGVLISLLTGDKTYLDDEIYNNFKMSGVAHIMAVSGQHLSIWIFLAIDIIQKRNRDVRKAVPFLMCLVLLIMSLAMFSGSILRAGFMMFVYLSGFLFRRKSDPLNSLGFAVTVILLFKPFICLNIGFLMSVVSTFSIIEFALPISDIIFKSTAKGIKNEGMSKILSDLISCVCVSFFASFAVLPLQIYALGGISLVGVLTNLLFLPVVTPLLVCIGLFCILGAVPFVSDVIGYTAIFLVGYCVNTVKSMADMRFSYVEVSSDITPVVLICVLVILTMIHFLLRKRKIMLTKRKG